MSWNDHLRSAARLLPLLTSVSAASAAEIGWRFYRSPARFPDQVVAFRDGRRRSRPLQSCFVPPAPGEIEADRHTRALFRFDSGPAGVCGVAGKSIDGILIEPQ